MKDTDILKIVVRAIDSKKGEKIEVLEVGDLTILAEYFVIAEASSSTQLKALADEVEYKLSLSGVEPHHIEGKSSGWICLDYNSVVVHIFLKEQRDFFDLERIWEDAKKTDVSKLLED